MVILESTICILLATLPIPKDCVSMAVNNAYKNAHLVEDISLTTKIKMRQNSSWPNVRDW